MDGDAERAVRLHGAADGLMKAMESPLWGPDQLIVEQYVSSGRRRDFRQDVRERMLKEGAAMSLDDAVAYALDEVPVP